MKKAYSKTFLALITLLMMGNAAEADCTLNGGNLKQEDVVTCLNSCIPPATCTEIQILGDVSFNGSWYLASFGDLTITIKAGVKLTFGGNDGIFLSSGSEIILESGAMLVENGTDSQTRITFGSSPGVSFTGGDFDLLNQLTVINAGTNLPVTLISFTACAEGSAIILQWATATEENNDHFLLEHSLDGQKFTSLTRIAGAGTTQQPQSYRYVHEAPARGLNYYRLVQVDYDGATTFYDVASAEWRGKGNPWSFQPNPASDFIELANSSLPGQSARATLYSLTGKAVKTIQMETGSRTRMELPASLPKGIYLLRLESGQEVLTKRIMVL